jgi:Fis family transcriptional regulator, factor for inversion stimulation protein
MLVRVVEKPLLDVVMARAEGNQSKAAQWLGLIRNTLRKKLVEHKLLK